MWKKANFVNNVPLDCYKAYTFQHWRLELPVILQYMVNIWLPRNETERHKRSCQIRIKQPFALTQLSLLRAAMQPRKSWTIIVENNCISHTDLKIQLAIYITQALTNTYGNYSDSSLRAQHAVCTLACSTLCDSSSIFHRHRGNISNMNRLDS